MSRAHEVIASMSIYMLAQLKAARQLQQSASTGGE